MSDLLAAGAEPQFFMHSISLPGDVNREFSDGLVEGIRKALAASDCALCGGDLGTADPWRFCGFGMGPIASGTPLTRRLPTKPQSLWVTGTLGDANLSVLQTTPTPQFELRTEEAALIRSCATGCIDTSGGLLDAVWLLHEQNPRLTFNIYLDKVPLAKGIAELAGQMGFPPAAALLGGAGEYELLFAITEERFPDSEEMLHSIGATRIGAICRDTEQGIVLHREDGSPKQMTAPPPCPRTPGTTDQRLEAVMTMAHDLFGAGEH